LVNEANLLCDAFVYIAQLVLLVAQLSGSCPTQVGLHPDVTLSLEQPKHGDEQTAVVHHVQLSADWHSTSLQVTVTLCLQICDNDPQASTACLLTR
jgi:hypothetical protein